MHRLSHLSGLLLITWLLCGCDAINPAEELPAYLSFKSPRVVIDESTGFSTDAGVRNIWLYHAGFLQGAYQIDPDIDTNGKVIPFLELDRTDFFIEGGIFETGQSSFQIPYPFWDRITFTWAATPMDTMEITPLFHYVDASRYDAPVDEHFDGGSIGFSRFASGIAPAQGGAPDSTTFFTLNNNDVFHGSGAGHVNFFADKRWFETVNAIPFITDQSSNIFAELTYKNTIPFQVGLVYQSASGISSQPIVTVSPSGEWNTIYVHMITEVRNIINANGTNTIFWLWIKADGEKKDGYIRFDDIRVIREN